VHGRRGGAAGGLAQLLGPLPRAVALCGSLFVLLSRGRKRLEALGLGVFAPVEFEGE